LSTDKKNLKLILELGCLEILFSLLHNKKYCITALRATFQLTPVPEPIEVQPPRTKPNLKYKKVLFNNEFSDFVCVVEGKPIHASRATLASGSEYFYYLFKSKMKESQEGKIIIEDVNESIFKKVLEFLYVDVVYGLHLPTMNDEELRLSDTLQLLIAADRFQMMELKHDCEWYLQEMDWDLSLIQAACNFPQAFAISEDFRKRCTYWVGNNFEQLIRSEEKHNWEAVLKDLLKIPSFTIELEKAIALSIYHQRYM